MSLRMERCLRRANAYAMTVNIFIHLLTNLMFSYSPVLTISSPAPSKRENPRFAQPEGAGNL